MARPRTWSTPEESRIHQSRTRAPSPERKKYNLVLIEIGFCRDFGCHSKLQEKMEN
jgi:hypothetical protein